MTGGEWTPEVAARLRAYRDAARSRVASPSTRDDPWPGGLLDCPQVRYSDERGGWVAFVKHGRAYARVWSRRSRPRSFLVVLWRP